MTIARLAAGLASDLESGAPKGDMLRLVRQYIMNAERCADLTTFLVDVPTSTGDVRWDAMVAAVAEWLADEHGIPTPTWAREHPRLEPAWWVGDFQLRSVVAAETPRAFARHGVYIRRASLINI